MVLWFWSLVPSIPNYLEVTPSPSQTQPPSLATCLSGKTCSREEVSGKAFMAGISKLYWMSNTCWVVFSGDIGYMHASILDMKEIIDWALLPCIHVQSQSEIHKGKLYDLYRCALSCATLGWNIHSGPVFLLPLSFSYFSANALSIISNLNVFSGRKLIWHTYFNQFSNK